MRSIHRAAVLASLAVLAAVPVHAQAPSRCAIVPDSLPGPTAQQIDERNELRDQIVGALQAYGAEPAGLLMVDVGGDRRGKLLFMEAELGDSARAAALSLVSEYIQTLQAGRPYQALIRIDGDYPALTPGRTHCRPELANGDSMSVWMQRVLERHPEADQHADAPLTRRVVVRMVVTREGHVAYVEMDTPSGDALIDGSAEAIARGLRFRPATLDGVPFDVRFRFTLTFRLG